jgi:hypothetical protein
VNELRKPKGEGTGRAKWRLSAPSAPPRGGWGFGRKQRRKQRIIPHPGFSLPGGVRHGMGVAAVTPREAEPGVARVRGVLRITEARTLRHPFLFNHPICASRPDARARAGRTPGAPSVRPACFNHYDFFCARLVLIIMISFPVARSYLGVHTLVIFAGRAASTPASQPWRGGRQAQRRRNSCLSSCLLPHGTEVGEARW